jgi:hypothetical protein
MCRLLSEFSKWPPLPWKPQKKTQKIARHWMKLNRNVVSFIDFHLVVIEKYIRQTFGGRKKEEE